MAVELCARTHYSFLQGASSPAALVQQGARLGYEALGITDKDGLYGMVRALEASEKEGLRLVVGCELSLDPEGLGGAVNDGPQWPVDNGGKTGNGGNGGNGGSGGKRTFGGASLRTLTLHVENHEGYTHLCRVLTESHRRHPKGVRPKQEKGADRNTWAGIPLSAVVPYAAGLYATAHGPWDSPAEEKELALLREAFGERLSLSLVRRKDGQDRQRAARCIAMSRRYGIPILATNRPYFAHREEKPLLDVLHCIREGMTLAQAGRFLLPNAEAHLKGPEALAQLFAEMPEALYRSDEVAEACRFSMRELKYQFPSEFTELGGQAPCPEEPNGRLRRLTYEGARRRYGEAVPEKVLQQIEKELGLIAHLEVAPYFLSVEAIVRLAREKDILCQGRGSAANSAVCFCLGVTAVDPARSSMLFERFLSAERREPPDIDVDFEHERREEVIQEIYARYGRERAAMVSAVICYRGKSALREVGKVFGFSLEEVDRLASLVSYWDQLAELPRERVMEAGFDGDDKRVGQVLALASALQGCPRHLSIHVGGFVLSAQPLFEVAPLEPATMPGRTVIPWDKDDLDALGFFKIDVLALGMLTAIRKALALSQDDEGLQAEGAIEQLARIPAEDPAVYEALCNADSVGIFQIESRAQMAMLPRLRPQCFYDLVVEVAIVRPGPIQGGMIHPYLRRRNGEEAPVVPHPCLEPILGRTLGVPIFQEQVMQMAMVGAGYTGGEADQLRRDMAAWKKHGRLEQHRERLHRGFVSRGISQEFSERLYKQIQGFGEYGFPESHAASFALLVYASAWLKVHKPAAFAAALVNSQPMGFYSPNTILQDAQRHGVEVRPICIEASGWDCTLEEGADGARASTAFSETLTAGVSAGASAGVSAGVSESGSRSLLARGPGKSGMGAGTGGHPLGTKAVRVGFRQVRGLGREAAERIVRARQTGPFLGVEDVVERARLHRGEVSALAEAGAFAVWGMGRREALWKGAAPRGEGLFAGLALGDGMPALPQVTRAQQLMLDYERTGISVADHPMRLWRDKLPRAIKSSLELGKMSHGQSVVTAGMVICRQRPQTASGVVFVSLEDEHGFINVVVFAQIFEQYRYVTTTSGMLVVHGKVEREKHVIYVVASRLERLSMPGGGAFSMSRDFH